MTGASLQFVPSISLRRPRVWLPVPGWLGVPLTTFVSYYLGSLIGIALRFPLSNHIGQIGILWPPNAALLAMLLLLPTARWWSVGLAAIPAHILAQWPQGTPPWLMLMQFTHNIGLAALAAGTINALKGKRRFRFDDLRQSALFIVVAVFIAPAVAALWPALIRHLTGQTSAPISLWWEITVSDALTNVILTPGLLALFALATEADRQDMSWTSRMKLEFGAMYLGLALTAILIFNRLAIVKPGEIPELLYLPLPFVLWAAWRFGSGGVSWSLFLIAIFSICNVMNGQGPFATQSPAENAMAIEFFLFSLSLPTILLAVVCRERQNAMSQLRRSEADARRQFTLLSTIYKTAPIGLAFIDTNLRFVEVNDFLAATHGVSTDDHVGRKLRDILSKEMADTAESVCRRVMETGQADLHREVLSPPSSSGEQPRYLLASHYPVGGDSGAEFGVCVILQDITEQKLAEAKIRDNQSALHLSLDRIQDLAGRLIEVQEAERSRIARELHDDVNQQLASLSLALSVLKRRMPPESRKEIEAVQQQAVEVTEEVRNLSHGLHSGVLQHAGLVPAVRALCKEQRDKYEIDTSFSEDGIGEVSADISLCIYRVVQEAMANVVRHAKARRVEVRLSRSEGGLELTIRDDGRGFDPNQSEVRHGLGLISIDERIRLVRGRVSIDSRPQQGTTIKVWVPRE